MIDGRRVIVIAPCFNEEVKIAQVVERVTGMRDKIVDEMLVVDDASTDGSAQAARTRGASVLTLPKRHGVGAALRAGFNYAIEKKHDLIVVMAGNNKDEPNEIPRLLTPILKNGAAFVQGSRYLEKHNMGHMPFYRKIATRLHPLIFSLFTGKWVTESTNGFRAFTTRLLSDERIKLNQDWLNTYELEPYLYYKTITLGYTTAEVPCTKVYPPKTQGYTKMTPLIGWWAILRPLFLLKLGLRD